MNLLVRREYEMPTNNSPENILHTAYETKMISSGDNSPAIKNKRNETSIFTCIGSSWF